MRQEYFKDFQLTDELKQKCLELEPDEEIAPGTFSLLEKAGVRVVTKTFEEKEHQEFLSKMREIRKEIYSEDRISKKENHVSSLAGWSME